MDAKFKYKKHMARAASKGLEAVTGSETLATRPMTRGYRQRFGSDHIENRQLSSRENSIRSNGEYPGFARIVGKEDEIVAAGLARDGLGNKSSLDYEYAEITSQISRV
jgi:hypothetical protein